MALVPASTMAQRSDTQVPVLDVQIAQTADRILAAALKAKQINAAAVVFVHNGRARFVKTYGYEDVARGTVANPDSTRLPIASVSKGFTGLAIAQLVASGRIRSIDDPVARYVRGFDVRGSWGSRLTIRHLLSHTGGFDEQVYGTYTDRLTGVHPAARDYVRALPPMLRPPGDLTVYSNRGASLLGAVVEGASGERFDAYLQRHIFSPAGMTGTVTIYRTPVDHQVKVYRRALDTPPSPRGPVFSDDVSVPAGGIAVTASDMARLMTRLLARDAGGALSRRVVDTAFAPIHATNAGVQSHAMLFELANLGGRQLVHHGGSLPGSQSWLFLLPDSRDGLFVFVSDWQVRPAMPFEPSFWTGPTADTVHPLGITDVTVPLLGVMLGKSVADTAPLHTGQVHPREDHSILGLYRGSRRVEGTMLKFMGVLFADVLDVTAAPKGGILVNGKGPYLPLGPELYADPATGQRIGFAESRTGEKLASLTFRSSDYVQVPRWTDPRPYALVWWLAIGVMLSGMLGLFWPTQTRAQTLAKSAAMAGAACAIAVPLALFAWDDSGYQLLFGGAVRFGIAKIFANSFLVLAPLLILSSIRAWREGWSGWTVGAAVRRIHMSMLAIAALLLLIGYGWVNFLGVAVP